MTFSVFGFDQAAAVALGLSIEALAVLRWFVDFVESGCMYSVDVGDASYCWVHYGTVAEAFPILRLGVRSIRRIFGELIEAKVLVKSVVFMGKGKGSKACFAFAPSYDNLLYRPDKSGQSNDDGPDNIGKSNTFGPDKSGRSDSSIPLRDSNNAHSATANALKAQQGKNGEYSPEYLTWYEGYPRKVGKKPGFKAWKRARKQYSAEELARARDGYAAQRRRDRTEEKYISYPASFLNSYVDDYLEVEAPEPSADVWTCECGRVNEGGQTKGRCGKCNTKRPKEEVKNAT